MKKWTRLWPILCTLVATPASVESSTQMPQCDKVKPENSTEDQVLNCRTSNSKVRYRAAAGFDICEATFDPKKHQKEEIKNSVYLFRTFSSVGFEYDYSSEERAQKLINLENLPVPKEVARLKEKVISDTKFSDWVEETKKQYSREHQSGTLKRLFEELKPAEVCHEVIKLAEGPQTEEAYREFYSRELSRCLEKKKNILVRTQFLLKVNYKEECRDNFAKRVMIAKGPPVTKEKEILFIWHNCVVDHRPLLTYQERDRELKKIILKEECNLMNEDRD